MGDPAAGLRPHERTLMSIPRPSRPRTFNAILIAAAGIFALSLACLWLALHDRITAAASSAPSDAASDAVTITALQAKHVHVVVAGNHDFVARLDAVGNLDFDQQRLAQVFSPYPGRVLQVLARAGDNVKQGQPLFTVESPDLIQAENTLIAASGTLALTNAALERARGMLAVQANAHKDLEQAQSDQQTAEASYRSAREALRIFGKSAAEIDRIVARRAVDDGLTIASPFAGRITTCTIAPGTLVQPGMTGAPFTVADLSSLWAVANIAEDEQAGLRLGQPVEIRLDALPDLVLHGTLGYIGGAVDPATHRITVHAQIDHPDPRLHPQMLATMSVQVGTKQSAVAVPPAAVVREGDGSMSVFATRDGRRFERREVQLGEQQDGLEQIVRGLHAGEQVAGDGALFISAALAMQSQ